jgi:MSHA biogenesis protein MshN
MDWRNKISGLLPRRAAKAAPAAAPLASATPATAQRKTRLAIIGLSVVIVCAALAGGGLWWRAKSKIVVPASPVQAAVKPILLPQAPAQSAVSSEDTGASAVLNQELAAAPVQEVAASHVEVTGTAAEIVVVQSAVLPSRPKTAAREAPQHHSKPEIEQAESGHEIDLNAQPVKRHAQPRATPRASRNARFTPPAGTEAVDALSRPSLHPTIDKQVKQLTVQQQAENQFRKASTLIQQNRVNEALAAYDAALQLDPGHDEARRAMVAVLLENKRSSEAEQVLRDALKFNPQNSALAMLLARLQVERDASWSALLTLQKSLPYAERQAEYQAFMAALLQRLHRPKEAVTRYQIALRMAPDSGAWLMGLGMSLQDTQRIEEARDAYRRALDTRTLTAELQAFVMQRMQELN